MSNTYFSHLVGQFLYKKTIEKNRKCRILVILHLYYMDSWPAIRKYLRNLSPYTHDLIVTYIPEHSSAETLEEIKKYKPGVKLCACENRGFDVGPFLEVLSETDLKRYDIVYKLHSKGTGRKCIYIYDQIFKRSDWFKNLYNAILGGLSVHATIDALYNNKTIGLVAAENLITQDPKHKQAFTLAYAREKNISINENYHFVAGTCFAIRAELLEQVKKWKIRLEDFMPTQRGTFSLAHAAERFICGFIEPLGYTMFGRKTRHPVYRRKLKRYRTYTALRLLEDPHIRIDYEFFYKFIEGRQLVYEIKELPLRCIKRLWNGQWLSLQETHAYRYLQGQVHQYREYCMENEKLSGLCMSEQRFSKLIHSLQNGYDKTFMPVVAQGTYELLDGQHRLCWLLNTYGPDYVIPVLCIAPVQYPRWHQRLKEYLKTRVKSLFTRSV